MTDMTVEVSKKALRSVDLTSEQARAHLRARYRSERRFKAFGIGALAVSTAFLAVLMTDIFTKGLPAFWQHSVSLTVALDSSVIDPSGKRDPEALKSADYLPLLKTSLSNVFPAVEGRVAKKQLNELLSSGAADPVRDLVLANPGLVGSTADIVVPLSSKADLYLKGDGTDVHDYGATKGSVKVSSASGEATLTFSANELDRVFADLKLSALARADGLLAESKRIARLSGGEARAAELGEEAAAIKAKYAGALQQETLGPSQPSILAEVNGGLIKLTSISEREATGEVYIAPRSLDEAPAGTWRLVEYATPESSRNISDRSIAFLEKLRSQGSIQNHFNWMFFVSGDSRQPELAGILGALTGSAMLLAVTLIVCLPIGVMAAIYLEQFAPKNWFTDLLEININNLAAVPSIVFGLLGLSVFLNFFGFPRSAPLVGGLVMALLVLPTIIIASRAALRAVPPSIMEAALGVGASKQQAIFHHVLPLAMPGIMTGTIIGMAHALGETAPLLMIGMIAFVVDIPHSLTDAATALPVQIYLWSDLPEPGFKAKTAAAIIVLLAFLFVMNGFAIWVRKKFERRW